MAVIIVTPQEMPYISGGGDGTGGGIGGGSSGASADGHTHSNLSILNKLSIDKNGVLSFNNSTVGEKALEVAYNLILSEQLIRQKYIELPNDCDISRIITLTLQGISMQQGTFWEVIEKSSPEKDLIAWQGLELEKIAQVGDSISISYYKKIQEVKNYE